MILSTAQRLLTLVVLGFAVMGFISVPVLGKTGFEHVRDLLQSDEAQSAGEEVARELSAMQQQLETELAEDQAPGEGPEEAEPALSRKEERQRLSVSATER